jgi:two-component system, OmpR family, response regulator
MSAAGQSASLLPTPQPLPRRILVVDDERDLADLAEALLCAYGLDVRVAYSAVEALEVLEHDSGIDAVFTDIMMPGMNGLQLAEAIRRFYPSIRILLTTGFTMPDLIADQGLPYPCITKPYRIETVLAQLRSS